MTPAIIPGLGSVGPTELIILLTIILLLFGAKRIPELAKVSDQASESFAGALPARPKRTR